MAWIIDCTDKQGNETRFIVKISHQADALATILTAQREANVHLDRVEITEAR